jgi:hypothetical protein
METIDELSQNAFSLFHKTLALSKFAGVAALCLFLMSCETPFAKKSEVTGKINHNIELDSGNSTVSLDESVVVSGTSTRVWIYLKDQNNDPFPYDVTPIEVILVNGTSSGRLGPVTNTSPGKYYVDFEGIVAGSQATVAVTAAGVPLSSTLPQVKVVPGPVSLAKSQVFVSAPQVSSGSSVFLTLVAKDAAGNFIKSGGLDVDFGFAGGEGSTGTLSDFVDRQDGTYTVVFTGLNAGSAVPVAASIDGEEVTSSPPSIQVVPGQTSASASTLTTPLNELLSGAMVTVTLTARDANGNAIRSGGRSVVFSYSGGASTGTLSSAIDRGNGTYTATLNGMIAGSPSTLRATIDGQPVTTTLPVVRVLPGAFSALQSQLSISAATLSSGALGQIVLQIRDLNGNPVSVGGAQVSFSCEGGGSSCAIGSISDEGNGIYLAQVEGVSAGSATSIKATVNGIVLQNALPSLTVIPGSMSVARSLVTVSHDVISSGETSVIQLVAKDLHGNNVTHGGSSVTFALSGGSSSGQLSAVADLNNGSYHATFTAVLAGTPLAVEAHIGANSVQTALPTIQVLPGELSLERSEVILSSNVIPSGSSATLTLVTRDSAGNALLEGGRTVSFNFSGGSGTGTISDIVDIGDGTYTASFTGVLVGSTTLNGAVGGQAVSSALPSVNIVPGAVSLAHSVLTSSALSLASGTVGQLIFVARDTNHNPLISGGLNIEFSVSGGGSTVSIGSTVDHGDGTYSVEMTGMLSGSPSSAGVSIGGVPFTGSTPHIQIVPGAVSLSQSVLSVSASSVVSGSGATLTLVTKDSAGNLIPSGGQSVVFSYSGGSSTGTISSTEDSGNGSYTSSFTGNIAGSATQIYAAISGFGTVEGFAELRVIPGPVSVSRSEVLVSAPTVQSGSSVSITLAAKDQNGNLLEAGGAVVAFSLSSGTSTGTMSSVTDLEDGHYTASLTGLLAGTGAQVKAMINGLEVSGPQPILTVLPGPVNPVQSVVSLAAAQVSSGSTVLIKLIAKDSNSNTVPTAGLSVLFSVSGGTSTGIIGPTNDLGNGEYTAVFTGVTAGTALAVSATVGGTAVGTSLPGLTVIVGDSSAAKSLVSVSSSVIAAGSSVTLTLMARDGNGNAISHGGAAVTFSALGGGSTGSIGSVVDHDNGTYSAIFVGQSAGAATTIHATLDGQEVSSTLPTLSVIPGSLSLARSQLNVSSSTLAAGTSTVLSLATKDAYGNMLDNGSLSVVFNLLEGTSSGLVSNALYQGDGIYSATFTAITSGSPRAVGASINGSPLSSAHPMITVNPAGVSLAQSLVSVSASSVTAGSGLSLSLTAKDAYGNALSSGGLAVVFTQSGGSGSGAISPTSDLGNGKYKAIFTGEAAGAARTIGATIGGSSVTSLLPTVLVLPGSVSLAQSTVSVSSGSVSAGRSVTFTLISKDSYGNQLTSGGLSVAFSQIGGSSSGNLSPVEDSNNGIYRAVFKGIGAGTAKTIGATIGGLSVTSSLPVLVVVPGEVSPVTSLVSLSSSNVISGSAVTLTLITKDAYGNSLGSGGLGVVFNQASGSGQSEGLSSGVIGTVNDLGNGSYKASYTGIVAGSSRAIGANIGGVAVSSTLPSITVFAGAVSVAQSVVSVSSASVSAGSSVTLTLATKDANGNPLNHGGLNVSFIQSGGSSNGVIGPVSNVGGVYQAVYTGTIAGTPRTIGASISLLPVTGTLPTVKVNPGEASLAASIVNVSSSTVVAGNSVVVTLVTKDAYGNSIGTGGLAIAFSLGSDQGAGTSSGIFGLVIDLGNGTYTSQFTGIGAGAVRTIGAQISGAAVASLLPTIRVLPGAASLSQSLVTVAPAIIRFGHSSTVTLYAKDGYGNNLNTGGLSVRFENSGGTSTGDFSSILDRSDGTYTSIFTGESPGTATKVRAEVASQLLTSVFPEITVTGVNLVVPIEMIDTGLSSNSSDSINSNDTLFNISRTNLNTTDYNGEVTYQFEVIAKNSSSSSETVKIIDSSNVVKGILSIPANTSQARYSTSFVPTSGANNYRVQLSGTNSSDQLRVYTARIIVKQVNATKTRLYIPLMADEYDEYSNSTQRYIEETNSTSYTQQSSRHYQIWKKDLSAISTLASHNAWSFEPILWSSSSSGSCYAKLFNVGTGDDVDDSGVSVYGSSPTLVSKAFSNESDDFENQSSFEVRIRSNKSSKKCRIAKAGLWVSLSSINKAEVYYRVEKGYHGIGTLLTSENSRTQLDSSFFGDSLVNVYYETTAYKNGSPSSGRLSLANHGSLDSGTDGATEVTGCSIHFSELNSDRSRVRSSSCSGVTNSDRYLNRVDSSCCQVFSASTFVIMQFQ